MTVKEALDLADLSNVEIYVYTQVKIDDIALVPITNAELHRLLCCYRPNEDIIAVHDRKHNSLMIG